MIRDGGLVALGLAKMHKGMKALAGTMCSWSRSMKGTTALDASLSVKNYRRFADSTPAQIDIIDGLTALVGVNNSGKSSLLRFFYEFRPILRQLGSRGGPWQEVLSDGVRGLGFPRTVLDPREVFHKGNPRDIEIDLRIPQDP